MCGQARLYRILVFRPVEPDQFPFRLGTQAREGLQRRIDAGEYAVLVKREDRYGGVCDDSLVKLAQAEKFIVHFLLLRRVRDGILAAESGPLQGSRGSEG